MRRLGWYLLELALSEAWHPTTIALLLGGAIMLLIGEWNAGIICISIFLLLFLPIHFGSMENYCYGCKDCDPQAYEENP